MDLKYGASLAESVEVKKPWQRPSGTTETTCLALARTAAGQIAFRNDSDADGPAIFGSVQETKLLFEDIKAGRYDHLLEDAQQQ